MRSSQIGGRCSASASSFLPSTGMTLVFSALIFGRFRLVWLSLLPREGPRQKQKALARPLEHHDMLMDMCNSWESNFMTTDPFKFIPFCANGTKTFLQCLYPPYPHTNDAHISPLRIYNTMKISKHGKTDQCFPASTQSPQIRLKIPHNGSAAW